LSSFVDGLTTGAP